MGARKGKGGEKWGLMRMGTAAFEMETSEHTLQDTTAVQLSPTNSLTSSHKSCSSHVGDTTLPGCQGVKGVSRDNPTSTRILPAQSTYPS